MIKSKTFPAETEFSELMDFFVEHIKTEEHEIITNTPPSYDVEVRTVKKYKIIIEEVGLSHRYGRKRVR